MQIILCRHATRERGPRNDPSVPLSDRGKKDVAEFGELLLSIRLTPTKYLSSSYVHARETAVHLRNHVSPGATNHAVTELACLTPGGGSSRLDAFVGQAQADSFQPDDVVFVVGHEPRIGRLAGSMTSTLGPEIACAGAVCVTASSLADLAVGQAKVAWRWAPAGTRRADLSAKLTSKMSVSGVLAGLTFTAVTVLLGGGVASAWRIAAILLLTAGAALFVASLYAYDLLQMPREYWPEDDEKPDKRARTKILGIAEYEVNVTKSGFVYAEMVWTWRFLFTPALALTTLGYLAILGDLRSTTLTAFCSSHAWSCDSAALFLGTIIVGLVVLYYHLGARPRLGAD